jgi:hypothetical protein
MTARTAARTAGRRRPRVPFTPRQAADFFRLFAASGSVAFAADRTGIARTTLYRERRGNPKFAERWTEARQLAGERLRDEAFRRAIRGIKRPVFQGGQMVGKIRHYDNRLLLALLKAEDPEFYGPKRPRADDRVPVDLAKRLDAADERVAKYEAELFRALNREKGE